MTFTQFAAAVAQGILFVLLPLLASFLAVAGLVYMTRWWIDRRGKS